MSTNYDEPISFQQDAIVAIDEVLLYVENKYGVELAYGGYTAADSLEKEHLFAYPISGDKAVDSFTVTKTDDGYDGKVESSLVIFIDSALFAEYNTDNLSDAYFISRDTIYMNK